MTGGAGSDDFNSIATNGLDTITDFNWGTTVTGSTTVDQLDLSATLTITGLADVDLLSANAVDVMTFYTRDGGTTWFGFVVGLGLA